MAEADFIAGMIHQLQGEHPELGYKDFAVLYRSNHLSRELEMAFRRSRVPYRLVGGQEFYKRREIKDAVAAIESKELQLCLRLWYFERLPKERIAERIERFFGVGSGVEIVSKPGEGTCVTLRLIGARRSLLGAGAARGEL